MLFLANRGKEVEEPVRGKANSERNHLAGRSEFWQRDPDEEEVGEGVRRRAAVTLVRTAVGSA